MAPLRQLLCDIGKEPASADPSEMLRYATLGSLFVHHGHDVCALE
jgi:hypothetical protein